MNLAHEIGLLDHVERQLAAAFRSVATAHGDEPDVAIVCRHLAEQCDRHVRALRPCADRYGEDAPAAPEAMFHDHFGGPRSGPYGLLRDLHDLHLLASGADVSWTLLGQAAQGARDADLLAVVRRCEGETALQMRWLTTRMKQAAPQVLLVAR